LSQIKLLKTEIDNSVKTKKPLNF